MFKETIQNSLNRLHNIPIFLLLLVILLVACGLFTMKIASSGNPNMIYFNKQCIYASIFLCVMFFVMMIDIRWIFDFAYPLYTLSLILLVSVTIIGHTAMGATRWLNLGFVKIQPSELIKLTLVLALAKYFHFKKSIDVRNLKTLLFPSTLVALPLILILKQPDLGTAITIVCIGIVMFFLSGVQIWKFLVSFVAVIASFPLIWKYLHDYQKKRILVFLNPESDPLGSGYNIIQSKIAIGSGGFFGKGVSDTTQASLNFLPEHQTDFVFALFAEGFGFLGSSILILIFTLLIISGVFLALRCKHKFGQLLIFGLTSVFSVNMLINLGMVTGMLPVVGIPLPFLSYGGSSLATTLILFGTIMNVAINYKIILSNNLSTLS